MTLDEKKKKRKEFSTIIKNRMVALVLFAVTNNAADVMDLLEKEGSIITSTAEMYFSK